MCGESSAVCFRGVVLELKDTFFTNLVQSASTGAISVTLTIMILYTIWSMIRARILVVFVKIAKHYLCLFI